jgi:hypothetical protein
MRLHPPGSLLGRGVSLESELRIGKSNSGWIALLLVASVMACVAQTPLASKEVQARGFPYQQGWLGADGAYSIPTGTGSSLWLFADTFVGPETATTRKQSTAFLHNTIAFSHCDAGRCRLDYDWPGKGTDKPHAVFTAPGNDWFWPMDGFVYNGTLYVALMQMHSSGSGAFGFAYSGSQLASVRNFMDPPAQWEIHYQKLNTGSKAVPGVSIIVNQGPNDNPDPPNPEGAKYAYFITAAGDDPDLALLRIPLSELDHLERPGDAHWEYLKTSRTWAPWESSSTKLPGDRAILLNPGASEMTVRYHSSTQQWIAVYPHGLGQRAYYSLSSSLTGGWGPQEDLFVYPEMREGSPNHTPNLFCYAVKEHPEVEAAGQLVFTYACNSSVERDIIDDRSLYHPIMVREPLPSH